MAGRVLALVEHPAGEAHDKQAPSAHPPQGTSLLAVEVDGTLLEEPDSIGRRLE
jgi:hypothetical protein